MTSAVASLALLFRLSVEVETGWGVTQARLERASLSYSYRSDQIRSTPHLQLSSLDPGQAR